ncbi:hypothetical protein IX39_00905 [Chryseobacterium formosense]|uniref:Uncharacterized protein n=1 Tax=Chryseobacterium formosense TaxID=236814 RepID=A0A085Z4A7_9FLAO|nr:MULTISPECIES: hypothetical protein [Chryseobacterium]KFE99270.1 hypothetical protein IX39_00905 [Chryseobacterium formosense]OCK52138.1 hypothetical protein BA768_13480 [Chryseobacterium sp. CBo1]SFT89688.1 hypothetical protein SAMN05421857_3994 [Chryseobacterium formosense]
MKKKISTIFIISSMLTTVGFLMDGDPKEPSMTMRFTEYFAMLSILFLLITTFYFTTNSLAKKLQKIRN